MGIRSSSSCLKTMRWRERSRNPADDGDMTEAEITELLFRRDPFTHSDRCPIRI
jgi:hypothetical protein